MTPRRPFVRCRVGLALWLLVGCADLPHLEVEACGNGVVEPQVDEDCDGVVDASLGEDLVCGPADDSAQACRYVCDGAECPVGWTCEDDGICRAPSGMFEGQDEPALILAAEEFVLADLFGDARAELVARAGSDLSVFSTDDEGFQRDTTLALDNARGRLATVDVDEDDYADLLVPAATRFADPAANGSIHALRHGRQRLQTAVVPQHAVATLGVPDVALAVGLVAVRPDPASAREVALVLGTGEGPRQDTLVGFVPEPTCPALPASAVATLGSPMGRTALQPASLAADATHPAIVAVPLADASGVVILSLQRTCGPTECGSFGSVGTRCVTTTTVSTVVDFLAPVDAPGCAFWDADADGGDDLVCHLQGDRIQYAVLEPTTGFGAPTELTQDLQGRLDLPPGPSRACDSGHAILAAADLDGDGRTDVVTPHGIFMGDPSGLRRAFARVRGDAWGQAVIGDFDGDGGLEVVASVRDQNAACSATQLEHLVPVSDSFSASIVPDSALPLVLRQGDLDGDGLPDVAMSTRANDGETGIVVFFGDTKEALEDRVTIGNYGSVDALVPVRSREGTDLNEDLIADLAIVSDDGEQWTLATGTTDRALLAPLALEPDDGVPVGMAPLTVLGGALLPRSNVTQDEPGPPDVLALADGHVWLYRDEDVHHGDNVVHWAGSAIPAPISALRGACSRWTVTERGAPGAVLAGIDGVPGPATFSPCDLDAAAPRAVLATLARTAAGVEIVAQDLALPADVRRPTSIAMFDFGNPDVGNPDEQSEATLDLMIQARRVGPAPRAALLLLADVERTDASAPTWVQLLPERDVWAAVPINADRDRALEVAVVTSDGLYIVDRSGDQLLTVGPVASTPSTVASAATVQLTAGELDGDALLDLALLVDDALFVYPSIPVD